MINDADHFDNVFFGIGRHEATPCDYPAVAWRKDVNLWNYTHPNGQFYRTHLSMGWNNLKRMGQQGAGRMQCARWWEFSILFFLQEEPYFLSGRWRHVDLLFREISFWHHFTVHFYYGKPKGLWILAQWSSREACKKGIDMNTWQ